MLNQFFLLLAAVTQLRFFSCQNSILPLFQFSDFSYLGGFRVPASTYGESNLNFAQGPLAYNSKKHSLYIVGHTHHQAIGEFKIPTLMKSNNVIDLNMAEDPIQVFSKVLSETTKGNPEKMDRIGGMEKHCDRLIVNAFEYYDAPGDNTYSTLVVEDADDIKGSRKEGYFTYNGAPPGHLCGWISEIPGEWQSDLGGTHITGMSSGWPIISRLSVGPSAFSFNPKDLNYRNLDTKIETKKLLDFKLGNGLSNDLSNEFLTNDIWTHLSRVVYGFIAPGTRTYITLGDSGGHDSGVCYKCTQDNGNLCGGYCSRNVSDNYLMYWLWDMNDLVDVLNENVESYDVRPYDYGKFPAEFSTTSFGGGTFDRENGVLYMTLANADREQGTYSNPPIVIAYQFNEDEDYKIDCAPFDPRTTISVVIVSVSSVAIIIPIIIVIIVIICVTLRKKKENDYGKKNVDMKYNKMNNKL